MWWYESINLICFIHQGLLDFFWAPSCHHVEFEFENVQESQEKYVIEENKQLEYLHHYKILVFVCVFVFVFVMVDRQESAGGWLAPIKASSWGNLAQCHNSCLVVRVIHASLTNTDTDSNANTDTNTEHRTKFPETRNHCSAINSAIHLPNIGVEHL